MSSKSHIIKQNDISLFRKKLISLINYKSIAKDVFNILIYLILILLFIIVAHLPKLSILLYRNINSLHLIVLIIFSYFFNFILFTEILSIRINYNTLFFKCSRALSWKQTLKEYYSYIFWLDIYITLIVTKIPLIVTNSFISHYNPNFWVNSRLANAALIEMIILIILQFEIWFWFLILLEKGVFLLTKGYRKVNNSSKVKSKGLDDFSGLITYKPTESKILLMILLIISILSAKIVSQQVDNYFVSPNLFNLGSFIFNLSFAFIIFVHITISLNSIVFSYLNVKYDSDFKRNIKSNLYIFLGSYFIFLNAIYFVKYLIIAFVYSPIDANSPEINAISTLAVLSGGLAYNNPINLRIMSFIGYFTFSILFTILIYIIFFYLNPTPCFIEFKLKYKQEIMNHRKEPINPQNSENLRTRIIKKLFLKQLRKTSVVKKFTCFYYIYIIGVPFVDSIYQLYLLVYDSFFGHHSYSIHVFKYQYVLVVYFSLFFVFSDFLAIARKIHKISLTSIIEKETLNRYFKYLSIHFSIATSCFIAIFINGVYRLSKDYGNIKAPEEIQSIQLLILFLTAEYVLSNVSQKVEGLLHVAIEKDNI